MALGIETWILIVFLIAGFVIGYPRYRTDILSPVANYLIYGSLVVLLVAMGAKIGVDDELIARIDTIGLRAFVIALGSIAGSVVLVKAVSYRLDFTSEDESKRVENGEKSKGEDQIDDDRKKGGSNRITLLVLVSLISGILAGIFVLPEQTFGYLDRITTYALDILLLGVGISIGLNRRALVHARRLGGKILVVPLMVAVGSVLGAVLFAYSIGIPPNQAGAVGAGFGWYSFSGVLLFKIHSVELGSLAFLANILRELITLVTLPYVVRYFGSVTGIAPGGATTMDVTLPVIKETAGDDFVIPAFVNGMVLTALSPFLIPFIISL